MAGKWSATPQLGTWERATSGREADIQLILKRETMGAWKKMNLDSCSASLSTEEMNELPFKESWESMRGHLGFSRKRGL